MPTRTHSPQPRRKQRSTEQRAVAWLAETKATTAAAVRAQLARSRRAFAGGHGGAAFRQYCDLAYRVFAPIHDDTAASVGEAYRFFGELHFLRMLSYGEPRPSDIQAASALLPDRAHCHILDYGCGLAQFSKALASLYRSRGARVMLHLADLPTIRMNFLRWDARHHSYATRLIACEPHRPARRLPKADVIVATEFLEHVYDPVRYIAAFDRALRRGGTLVTNVKRHKREFMHVTPDLSPARRELLRRNYRQVGPGFWRKPR